MPARPPRPVRSRAADRMTLADAGRDYFGRSVTWERMAPAAIAIGARMAFGRWRRADTLAVAAGLVSYPILEWVTHHVVLHGLPLAGRQVAPDSPAEQMHLDHHRASDDLDSLFVRFDAVPTSIVAAMVGSVAATPVSTIPLTGLATNLVLMNVYHWAHYLMHAPYDGRSGWYRAIEDNHMLHHEVPEEGWRMGVLFATGDHLVGALRGAPSAPGEAAPTHR